ncbi:EAL domain-containing protein [Marinicellulosiphila megalodicopiae]|uniref:EAL domain-containing protein n=1 Tax=Marinicellulosiphila megalodicopiae TaxID=2724896 RepID=UPI003BAE723C
MSNMLNHKQHDNTQFLSQLPVHLQKIQTIWNKLVNVGWVESTFNNLDKTLLKLISISEQQQYFDLYYQTVDIHRLFSDILNEKRSPDINEFKKIQKKIDTLCGSKTIESITSEKSQPKQIKFHVALLIKSKNKEKIDHIFTEKPNANISVFHTFELLQKQLEQQSFDAVLVYLDESIPNQDSFIYIKDIHLKCKNVIAVSPRTDAHIRLNAIRFKCTDFLQVPILESQFNALIDPSQNESPTINVVGLFIHAKQTDALCSIMQQRKINLHCAMTPLELVYDCIEQKAQIVLLFDIEQRITIELVELLQSHPQTCLLPIFYASTKPNNTIGEKLIKYAVHNMTDCAKRFDQLTNRIYILGKHQIHLTQHLAQPLAQHLTSMYNIDINEEKFPKILSTESFLNEYQYIFNHLKIDQKSASHFCFNIKISYLSNGNPIDHLGFSQKQKLANITKKTLEALLLNNDIVCQNGIFDYLLIKEIIDEHHAIEELTVLADTLSNLHFFAKPYDLKLIFQCVGSEINDTHNLDTIIDFTDSVLRQIPSNSQSIKIMRISNSINTSSLTLLNETNNAIQTENILPDHHSNTENSNLEGQKVISTQQDPTKADIVSAFKNDGIFMKYQPIVDVQKNLAVFEAYARLCDNHNLCFDPGLFFPIIIQQDLAHEFNRKIIQKALAELSSHNKISQEADLILKLLPSNNTEEDNLNKILPWFSNQLTSHRLMGKNRIIFELTEPWVIKHFEQARIFTEKVKQLNCSICIDHSDLNETTVKITNILQPSYIKIEPTIKPQLVNAQTQLQQSVIQHLIENNIHIVASCVETADEFSSLWDSGIRYFQGYYVQQPMDQPDFLKNN